MKTEKRYGPWNHHYVCLNCVIGRGLAQGCCPKCGRDWELIKGRFVYHHNVKGFFSPWHDDVVKTEFERYKGEEKGS